MQHRAVCAAAFNRTTMSDDAAIRRENLKAIIQKRGWSISDLPEKMDWGRYSYWRDLLETAAKSFGEKVARRIEERLALPRGALDEPGYGRSGRYPKATEPIAERTASDERFRVAAAFFAELFPRVSLDRLSELDPELLTQLEDGLLFTASVLHVDIQAASARTATPVASRRKHHLRHA